MGLAIRKYGKENFEIKVIDQGRIGPILDGLEKDWIRKYDSTNRAKGYNLSSGGQGKNLTKEAKIRTVKFFIRCEETDEIFATQQDASNAKQIHASSINNCLRGKIETAGGFHWKKVETDIYEPQRVIVCGQRPLVFINTKLRRIICNETGVVYPSMSFLANLLGVSVSRISQVVSQSICYRGATYRFLNSSSTSKERPQKRATKRVRCLETEKEWDSLAKAAHDIGCDTSYMSQIVKNRGGIYKGNTYSYA